MGFVWSQETHYYKTIKYPLKIMSSGHGSVSVQFSKEITRKIMGDRKEMYIRVGIDIEKHKIGVMFQNQMSSGWRPVSLSKDGFIKCSFNSRTNWDVGPEELKGCYADFHCDKDAGMWIADIAKRVPLRQQKREGAE